MKLGVGVLTCLTLILSFSVLSQADNDFSASTKALQEQGFIRPDVEMGGPPESDEMALNSFRETDQLNIDNIFGRLRLTESDPPRPNDRFFYNYNHFGTPPPDTRSMGFERDPDHYIPISRLQRID
jgi:hypothetical protein